MINIILLLLMINGSIRILFTLLFNLHFVYNISFRKFILFDLIKIKTFFT